MGKLYSYLLISIGFVICTSCATYHDLSAQYQQQVENKSYKAALTSLDKNKFLKKDRNQLLFYVEKGKVAHLSKEYTLSNEYFNKADVLIELNRKRIAGKILGVLTNPEKEDYRAEDFEKVAIHYYKALNYIFLKQYDEALVEAKRINLQLQKINDRYPEGKKNRYTSDAFALNLQGLLYEATGNINDAFIAYRNAVALYTKNDGTYFGVHTPEQLQQDIINTAHVLGFYQEEAKYAKLFNKQYDPRFLKNKSLVVFWENGLVPYKSQTYFTFTALPGINTNFITFTNQDLGLSFDIPVGRTRRADNSFSDLNVINVSFPTYQTRTPYYTNATIGTAKNTNNFQLAQNYQVIATQTLKDRTAREIGKVLLRIATKKIAEGVVANQNGNLGALLGLINAFTEKSDTRNWQTLPHSIYYSRVFLEKENTELKIKLFKAAKTVKEEVLKVNAKQQVNFVNYITPEINRYN